MPLCILSKEYEYDEVILERRLNIIIFTTCWSLGSKIILSTIFNLSSEKALSHVNFYRIDINETNFELTQRLNIVRLSLKSFLIDSSGLFIDNCSYNSMVFSWK